MSSSSSIDRRTFVAGQAVLATAAALPSAVAASTAPGGATAAAACAQPGACAAARWDTATAADLLPMVGDRFRVQTRTHGTIVLRLSAVEPVSSGSARPATLPRAEGVVAVFESPDMAPLVDLGHQVHRVQHARLGKADLLIGPSPKRGGGHVIELVLN